MKYTGCYLGSHHECSCPLALSSLFDPVPFHYRVTEQYVKLASSPNLQTFFPHKEPQGRHCSALTWMRCSPRSRMNTSPSLRYLRRSLTSSTISLSWKYVLINCHCDMPRETYPLPLKVKQARFIFLFLDMMEPSLRTVVVEIFTHQNSHMIAP